MTVTCEGSGSEFGEMGGSETCGDGGLMHSLSFVSDLRQGRPAICFGP